MLHRDEARILKTLRMAPLVIILFSIATIFLIIFNNKVNFDQQIARIYQDSTRETKERIKDEVDKVHALIRIEREQTVNNIKNNIKNRVHEAHAIAMSIYQNNKTKDPNETKSMIKNALIDIKFNNGRGYFFVYDLNGVNIMHPVLKNIEGENLWDFKDVKGTYVIRHLSEIAKQQGEGYFQWWWTKPNDIVNEYNKIGFVKHFKPLNWFIGTGDYVEDYENELKREILEKIGRVSYGKNGYIFVVDNSGVFLSHIKKSYIGQNRIDLVDDDGVFITKSIIDIANSGEGYLSYIGTIKPDTGKPARKLSFIKGYRDWGWAIGTGSYLVEIDKIIEQRKQELDEGNREKIIQIVTLSLVFFVILIILTLLFSNSIKRRFTVYRDKVEENTVKLDTLNKNLENQVKERTKDLNQKIEDLKSMQAQLIESEKLASLGGLVAGVAHEINTPVGISITGITHIIDLTKGIESKYNEQSLKSDDFECYLSEMKEAEELINLNLERTAKLIRSFKMISSDQTSEEVRRFNVYDYMSEILLSVSTLTRKNSVQVELICDENIQMHGQPGYLSQVFTNLIMNSIAHGFTGQDNNRIRISVEHNNSVLIFSYEDNGVGIPEEHLTKIFDPFFTTNRDKGGLGLGLNIVHNIVTSKLNGRIECTKPRGEWVQFVISIADQQIAPT